MIRGRTARFVAAGALAACALAACADERPAARAAAGRADGTAAREVGSSPPADATAPGAGPPAAGPGAPAAVLPPRDAACATAADCAYDRTYLLDGRCCDGTCAPQAASARHVAAVADACASIGRAPRCPTKKCAAPPPLACVEGACVLGR